MKKVIAVDMDGVLSDIELQTISWYEKKKGVRVLVESLKGKRQLQAFDNETIVYEFLNTPNFFRSQAPIENAVFSIKKLMEKYDVFIVSSAMEFPLSLNEKYEWLREHFPFISWKNIVFCGCKSLVKADVLIDDHLKNLNSFGGLGVLFTTLHNFYERVPYRADSWKDALELIESLERDQKF